MDLRGGTILFAVIALMMTAHGASTYASADELLRVEGYLFRWSPPVSGSVRTVTYATLTQPYLISTGKSIASPNNCGSMNPLSAITANSTGISPAQIGHELQSAFAAWEVAANLHFVEVGDTSQADIIIGSTVEPTGRAFTNLSYRPAPDSSLAVEPVAEIDQAFICLNPDKGWKVGFDGNLDIYDLRHTFIHEIGHAIGLDHPANSGSMMAFRYDESIKRLQQSDISAVQMLYGPKSQTK